MNDNDFVAQIALKLAGLLFFIGGCSYLFVSTIEPNVWFIGLMLLDFVLSYFCFTSRPGQLNYTEKKND